MPSAKILITDNRVDRVAPLAASLKSAGYSVTVAADRAHATAAATGADLLITHYTLRNCSGIELCQQLRHDPRTACLPAILLTAPGYTLPAAVPSRTGIRKIVPADSSPRDIVSTVSEVLSRRAA